MKIAQINNNLIPVNRNSTGSIASHVGALSDELTLLGNDVDVYAAEGSVTNANLVDFPVPDISCSFAQQTRSMRAIVDEAVARTGSQQYDIIQSHLWPTAERLRTWRTLSEFALVCSVLHTDPAARLKRGLAEFPELPFIAFSQTQAARLNLNWIGVVHHGVDTDYLAPKLQDILQEKVAVIGKIKPSKQTHKAILAGLAAGQRVEVAGPVMHDAYFNRFVAPLIDNDRVIYRGVISGEEKRRLYSESLATIITSREAETFCLVIAESMACATPVVGINASTIPELVDPGVTGFVVDKAGDLQNAIHDASELDRAKIRETAVRKYSLTRMAQDYQQLYVSHSRQPQPNRSKPPLVAG